MIGRAGLCATLSDWTHRQLTRSTGYVPKHVGRYGDRYAWVTPDGMPGLARFTVTVLGAVRLEPGRTGRSHSLSFTR